MATAADTLSPYDDITSDDLFDSFMDVVSSVEQSFTEDDIDFGFKGNSGDQLEYCNKNIYEDIDEIKLNNGILSNNTEILDVFSKTPVERKYSAQDLIPSNDSKHLPLLVKLCSEPIYELCGKKYSDNGELNCSLDSNGSSNGTSNGTSNDTCHKESVTDIDEIDNPYANIDDIISSSPKHGVTTTKQTDINNTNTNGDSNHDNSNHDNSYLDNSNLDYRTMEGNYIIYDKKSNLDYLSDEGSLDNIPNIQTYTSSPLYETIGTVTTETKQPVITDIYAKVNKPHRLSQGTENIMIETIEANVETGMLSEKSQILVKNELNSGNGEITNHNVYNSRKHDYIEISPVCNFITNTEHSNTCQKFNIEDGKNNYAEVLPAKINNEAGGNKHNNDNGNHCNYNHNNHNDTKSDYEEISSCKNNTNPKVSTCSNNTENEYELISNIKLSTQTSVSSETSLDTVDATPMSPDITFNAEQIAYGICSNKFNNECSDVYQACIKTIEDNHSTPHPPKSGGGKDKRNFFGFGKWKSTDDTSKSPSSSTDDLRRNFSPPPPHPHRQMSNIPVLCSGYLFKQGGTGFTPKNWRLRWFQLKKDNCLYYYKSEQDQIPNGAVILVKYQVSRAVEVNKRFAFKLSKGAARTYLFAANSEDEMKKWMNYLGDAVTHALSDHSSIPECSLKNVSISAASIADPDCHGFLTKQGNIHKNWKRRYCVLKYGCLFYYEDIADRVAIGVFKLHKHTIHKSENMRYGFEAVPPMRKMRTYYFYTNTETDTRRWIDAMKRSIALFQ